MNDKSQPVLTTFIIKSDCILQTIVDSSPVCFSHRSSLIIIARYGTPIAPHVCIVVSLGDQYQKPTINLQLAMNQPSIDPQPTFD